MANNRKIWSGIRIKGHQLNLDGNGCNCGAKPEGWDRSIPIRMWHGEHKLTVMRYNQEKEKEKEN
jgi:hypothetical protein